MKTLMRNLTCACATALACTATAELVIPSDGSDGALVITNNTVIDLSQAIPGNWDADNTAYEGRGIYDSNKWAVVFKYSSVRIEGGATVTFKNHASRAPVVWLVQGDVTINGTVSLDGQGSQPSPFLAEPGPGGFRGGMGYYGPGAGHSAGFGVGGGSILALNLGDYGHGYGGSYGGLGPESRVPIYGNPSIIPLIGGAGGGGSSIQSEGTGLSGGAGGGAILIACGSTLSLSGEIRAAGGSGGRAWGLNAGSGSGGGIRLVAGVFTGNGSVYALGGSGGYAGGIGRIRIERITDAFSGRLAPTGPSVVQLGEDTVSPIWLPPNGPTVCIVSIGGYPAPADPRSGFGSTGADTVLPRVTNTTVVLLTTNVEPASVVTVRATPRSNGNYSQTNATISRIVSTNEPVVEWTANVPVQDGYSAIQVKVVRP